MAIVGAGITGAAVAYLFARAGISVAVVDAGRVGRGSTAASTALLMQEPDTDFRELAARYGPARAARMWDLSRDATRGFIRTLQGLKIPCDLERRDSGATTRRGSITRRCSPRNSSNANARVWAADGSTPRR